VRGDPTPGRGPSLSFLAASGLVLCLLALQMLIGAAFHDLQGAFEYGDPRSIVISVVSSGLLISLMMHLQGTSYPELFGTLDPRAPSLATIGIALSMAIVGSLWWLSEILFALDRLLPPDPYALAMLERLLGGGIVSVVAVCLVAPVIEEMFYRGVLLRGLLGRYSARTAIVLSSGLFAAVHMNVYQTPGAFVFGLFVGWVYLVYRSLWPCIFAHALMNSLSVAASLMDEEAIPDSLTIDILSFVVSALGVFIIFRASRTADDGKRLG